jgi:hypothetical protein
MAKAAGRPARDKFLRIVSIDEQFMMISSQPKVKSSIWLHGTGLDCERCAFGKSHLSRQNRQRNEEIIPGSPKDFRFNSSPIPPHAKNPVLSTTAGIMLSLHTWT